MLKNSKLRKSNSHKSHRIKTLNLWSYSANTWSKVTLEYDSTKIILDLTENLKSKDQHYLNGLKNAYCKNSII
ncbi:hypothetical protein HYD56_00900 [Mycoplasmopsis bovis]|nr:hypothetical protein HYD56_00900 [Mycoplasmopsis bovis]